MIQIIPTRSNSYSKICKQSGKKKIQIIQFNSSQFTIHTFAKHFYESWERSSEDIAQVFVVGDCCICRVSADVENLAGVHQLGREELEREVCLDDPPSLHVGHVGDGVVEDFSDLRV